ncbi:MAG: SoxR reducing system RseC family protein [bacterium]
MSAEEGMVTSVEGPYALVRVVRSAGCAHCPSAGFCHIGPDQTIIVKARNSAGARVGQRVQLSVAPGSVLAASFLLYLLPLAGLILGSIAGKALVTPVVSDRASELFAAVAGLSVMAGIFFGIRFFDRRRKSTERFMPQIIQVL